MNFAEHLAQHTRDDGTVDLNAAEQARAAEIADTLLTDPAARQDAASKAAKHERAQWERQETATLRKQFRVDAVNHPLFDLDPDVMVPLGDGRAVRLGSMTRELIRLRRAMRTDFHNDEVAAFDAEMTFWDAAEDSLTSSSATLEESVNDDDEAE